MPPGADGGSPDGAEAVIFVHGNPGSADDWRELLPRAGELGREIAPGMPGYGHVGKAKDFRYSVDSYAEYLAALLDQLGITRAHIVAHDFEGLWALAWAARHPGALASATLVNTGMVIDYRWHHYARIWRTPVLGEVFMATVSRLGFRLLLGRENPRLTRDLLDLLYNASRSWATKRAVLKLYPKYGGLARNSSQSEALRNTVCTLTSTPSSLGTGISHASAEERRGPSATARQPGPYWAGLHLWQMVLGAGQIPREHPGRPRSRPGQPGSGHRP
jgi:pimeloyl-ACP methyl ester carboxylesterase